MARQWESPSLGQLLRKVPFVLGFLLCMAVQLHIFLPLLSGSKDLGNPLGPEQI